MANFILRFRKGFQLLIDTLETKEIDSKQFRQVLAFYCGINDIPSVLQFVTDIKVFKEKDKYILRITTHRPGVLIGKGGELIDHLTDYLNSENLFDKRVELDLRESDMWKDLFSNY